MAEANFLEALISEAEAMAADGRADVARVLRERALIALVDVSASHGAHARLAAVFLAAGDPQRALLALGDSLNAPETPPPVARAAIYGTLIKLRGEGVREGDTSEIAMRALRLVGFHPDEIRRVQEEIARLLDPYAGEHGGQVDRLRPAVDTRNVYTICMTPRSGSNFLVECLGKTDVLGRPGEYLHRNEATAMPSIVARFGTPTLDAAMAEIMHRTRSPNGVFGTKVHIGMLLPLLAEGTFARTLAPGKFIYTTRNDLLMQAVSYARAQMTGAWTSKNEPTGSPEFSFEAIHGAIRHLSHMMAQWETFFAFYGIKPLRISYEEINRDVDAAIARIAAHVGVTLPAPTHFRANRGTVQRDDTNAAWRDRFLQMNGARA